MAGIFNDALYYNLRSCWDVRFMNVGNAFSEHDPLMMFSVELVDKL
jgi:hypothetical protein